MTRARRMLLIGVGGAAGGVARTLVAVVLPIAAAAPAWSGAALLAVNLSGSLLAGYLRGIAERDQQQGRDIAVVDALLIVGFCGGFTSYSGFVAAASAETAWIAAATLALCPLVALAGMRLSGGYPARPAGNPS